MKINFKKNFVDSFGCPITEVKNGLITAQEIWRFLASTLFNLSSLNKEPLSKDNKYMAYCLSKRIAENPEVVECTTEEASFIKDVCAEMLNSGAYGQVVDLIENNVEP